MNIQLIVLVSGAMVMGLEILAGRLLAPYFGSALLVWGSLIGVMLSALAIGYWTGGRLADKLTLDKAIANTLLGTGLFVLLIPLISKSLLPIFAGLGMSGVLLSASVMQVIPGILLGMIPPFALKMSTKKLKTVGESGGNLYAISTLGSIIGTFATTFFLIPMIGVTSIIIMFAVILILLSLYISRRRYILPFLILLVIFLPGNFVRLNNYLSFAADDLQYKTIYSADSSYYHITVVEDRLTGNERVLIMDNLRHSSMYLDRPNESAYRYPYYFNAAFAFNPEIRKVLFIGGGGFSAPKKFLELYDDIEIDVVEIDPEVIEVAKDFFYVPDDTRLNIHEGDGRVFLERAGLYDLIVLDAYSSTYVPFHLMTQEFFIQVKEHLEENGVVAFNLITPIAGGNAKLFRSEYLTISSVFRNVHMIPLGPTILPGNVIIIATDADLVKDNEYSEEIYEGNITTQGAVLLTDDYAPVNLVNPMLGTPLTD